MTPPTRLRRWQEIAFYGFLLFTLLTVGAGLGARQLPAGLPFLAWVLHPVVGLLGAACGFAAVARSREIERERWRVLADDTLTSGERSYAHREAEGRKRRAGTIFLLAALSVGYWSALQLQGHEGIGPGDLLIVSPIAGFLVGAVVGIWSMPAQAPEF